MPVHPRVIQWINQKYSRPRVDPEWLEECCAHLVGELQLNPESDFDRFIDSFETQLLGSNLNDSTLPGTGLPPHINLPTTTTVLEGPPVLVEIILLTEIGESAFNLNQTRIAREETTKDATVYDAEDAQDVDTDDEGPLPRYSRGMLKLHLSDGTTVLPAIEYRSLPDLTLEDTRLGYKMFLKDVMIRRGIAFLEPKSVVLIGSYTDDYNQNRQADFAHGLRQRMGLPDPEPQNHQAEAQVPVTHQQSPDIRSPLREISPPPSPPVRYRNDDEDLDTRRRRVPNRVQDTTPAALSPTLVASSSASSSRKGTTTSSYFTVTSIPDFHIGTSSKRAIDLDLSPNRAVVRPVLSPPNSQAETPVCLTFPPDMPAPRPLFIDSPPPSPNPQDDGFWETEKDNPPPMWVENTAQSLSEIIQGKQREKEHSHQGYGSDDFGDDDMFQIDDETLEKLNAVEKEAYAGNSTTTRWPPSIQSQAKGSSSVAVASRDIITIEDDDDEGDDKENFPVPTRHVRRRTEEDGMGGFSGGRPGGSQRVRHPNRPIVLAKTASAVIDLSGDSD